MFEHFYYEAIRKTVIAFGTLFNNIYIKHKNDEGKVVSTQKVAFAYGPTQKFLARLEQSPDLSKPIQITTPRMSMASDHASTTPLLSIDTFLTEAKNARTPQKTTTW